VIQSGAKIVYTIFSTLFNDLLKYIRLILRNIYLAEYIFKTCFVDILLS